MDAATIDILPIDEEPVKEYLDNLEVLTLLTPMSQKRERRFLELIDRLRAELKKEKGHIKGEI